MKKKHSYYDSDHKKITEKFGLKLIAYSFVMTLMLIIIILII
jgi:hypothetical protein